MYVQPFHGIGKKPPVPPPPPPPPPPPLPLPDPAPAVLSPNVVSGGSPIYSGYGYGYSVSTMPPAPPPLLSIVAGPAMPDYQPSDNAGTIGIIAAIVAALLIL